ncbi:MAG: DsbA family oxidoreductase, partial [Pseudomonadota bacterium]|nr:DsbA family oxidoreductase [Pseudomonadota bacterium]
MMLQIEIFSDVVCPWCYIGKRRFERAHTARPHTGLAVTWRAFQLNPEMPADGIDRQRYLELKFGGGDQAGQVYHRIAAAGAEEGIDFAFDRIRRTPNTVNAHRLVRWARQQDRQDEVVESLFQAYFLEGLDIGDRDNLAEIAARAGLDRADASAFLDGVEGVREVLDETRLAYNSGITGVPCFIVDRKYAISGAQEPEAFFPLFDLD